MWTCAHAARLSAVGSADLTAKCTSVATVAVNAASLPEGSFLDLDSRRHRGPAGLRGTAETDAVGSAVGVVADAETAWRIP